MNRVDELADLLSQLPRAELARVDRELEKAAADSPYSAELAGDRPGTFPNIADAMEIVGGEPSKLRSWVIASITKVLAGVSVILAARTDRLHQRAKVLISRTEGHHDILRELGNFDEADIGEYLDEYNKIKRETHAHFKKLKLKRKGRAQILWDYRRRDAYGNTSVEIPRDSRTEYKTWEKGEDPAGWISTALEQQEKTQRRAAEILELVKKFIDGGPEAKLARAVKKKRDKFEGLAREEREKNNKHRQGQGRKTLKSKIYDGISKMENTGGLVASRFSIERYLGILNHRLDSFAAVYAHYSAAREHDPDGKIEGEIRSRLVSLPDISETTQLQGLKWYVDEKYRFGVFCSESGMVDSRSAKESYFAGEREWGQGKEKDWEASDEADRIVVQWFKDRKKKRDAADRIIDELHATIIKGKQTSRRLRRMGVIRNVHMFGWIRYIGSSHACYSPI